MEVVLLVSELIIIPLAVPERVVPEIPLSWAKSVAPSDSHLFHVALALAGVRSPAAR